MAPRRRSGRPRPGRKREGVDGVGVPGEEQRVRVHQVVEDHHLVRCRHTHPVRPRRIPPGTPSGRSSGRPRPRGGSPGGRRRCGWWPRVGKPSKNSSRPIRVSTESGVMIYAGIWWLKPGVALLINKLPCSKIWSRREPDLVRAARRPSSPGPKLAVAPAATASPVRGDYGTHGSAAGRESAKLRSKAAQLVEPVKRSVFPVDAAPQSLGARSVTARTMKRMPMTSVAPQTGRRLPVWGFGPLVVGYLAAVQLIPRLDGPIGTTPTRPSAPLNPSSAACG